MGCYAKQCYSYPHAWLEVSNLRHQLKFVFSKSEKGR